MVDVALGFKPHTGWAIAVLVSGDAHAPHVLVRERIDLVPQHLERFAYHQAQEAGLTVDAAARSIAEIEDGVDIATTEAVKELAATAAAHGTLVAAGVIGHPQEVPPLAKVLASHTLLHTAEGELYRSAIEEAAADLGIVTVPVAPKQTVAEVAAALGVGTTALDDRLTALRKELGAPWQKDHREATAAALLALQST
jgi:hypothetical protein